MTIKHRGGSLNRCLSPYKVKNMQLRGGSAYIAKMGPFLIGDGKPVAGAVEYHPKLMD